MWEEFEKAGQLAKEEAKTSSTGPEIAYKIGLSKSRSSMQIWTKENMNVDGDGFP